jgi:hypothetical protein
MVTMVMSMDDESTHAVLPWLLICPKPQALHAADPTPLMVSSAQATHVAMDSAPAKPEAVPAGHASHCVSLDVGE